MNKLKITIFAVLIANIISFLPIKIANAEISESKLDTYVKYFYNKYSSHFDTFGLSYSSPTYGIADFKKPSTAREWISLASYYKYKAQNEDNNAKQILKQAMLKATDEIKSRPAYTQSFNDAEAFFLIIRMMEFIPELLTPEEKETLLGLMANSLEEGISAGDTENRAIIAGTHWQYINNYLYRQGKITANKKQSFDELIKSKVDLGIKQSIIVNSGWYFENQKKDFSAHYHAISAFMLMTYGDLTQQNNYTELAKRMYFNIKKVSFNNGMVEARVGNRPIGLGAQFYLSMGLLGKYFDDDDYRVYLFYGNGNRFFTDKARPNRLEFHSSIEFSKPNHHDDYAFSDIAELGLISDELKNLNINCKYYFSQPIKQSKDEYFNIINSGKTIFVNNQKISLGSWGNWSHVGKTLIKS